MVTLTAIPSAGYRFEKWSGDIGENAAYSATIKIMMDAARTITADFVAPGGLYTITVNASPSSGGIAAITTSFGSLNTSINQSSISILCASGTAVDITAVAFTGYQFDGWQGDFTGTQGNMSFIVNSSETITAKFAAPSSFPWPWVIIGIAAISLIALLVIRFMPGKAKRPDDFMPLS